MWHLTRGFMNQTTRSNPCGWCFTVSQSSRVTHISFKLYSQALEFVTLYGLSALLTNYSLDELNFAALEAVREAIKTWRCQ